jgi:hypothetical protein
VGPAQGRSSDTLVPGGLLLLLLLLLARYCPYPATLHASFFRLMYCWRMFPQVVH